MRLSMYAIANHRIVRIYWTCVEFFNFICCGTVIAYTWTNCYTNGIMPAAGTEGEAGEMQRSGDLKITGRRFWGCGTRCRGRKGSQQGLSPLPLTLHSLLHLSLGSPLPLEYGSPSGMMVPRLKWWFLRPKYNVVISHYWNCILNQ